MRENFPRASARNPATNAGALPKFLELDHDPTFHFFLIHNYESGLSGAVAATNDNSERTCSGSWLLFLAELLESRIGAQRVPDRIEPKKRRRNGRYAGHHA